MAVKMCPLIIKTNFQVLGFHGCENLGCGLQRPGIT
jgi:hypothetical protein